MGGMGPMCRGSFHNDGRRPRTMETESCGLEGPRLYLSLTLGPPSDPPLHWASLCTSENEGLEWMLVKAPVGLHFQRDAEMIYILFGSPPSPQHGKYWESGGYLVGAQ